MDKLGGFREELGGVRHLFACLGRPRYLSERLASEKAGQNLPLLTPRKERT